VGNTEEFITTLVTLAVPDGVYQQAEAVARTENRAVEEVLTDTLVRALPEMPLTPNFAEMVIEGQHYEKLHSQLVKKYLGQTVAMLNGTVIDHDHDIDNLIERVRAIYPTETILFRNGELEVNRVLPIRWPRLLR